MARLIGVLYLLTIVAAAFAEGYVSGRLVVFGDAAATATNIRGQRSLYQLGYTFYLVEMSCQIAMTVLLYYLFKPVSRSASMVAATFELTGCTIKSLARLFYWSPILVLGDASYLKVFNAEQLQAFSMLSLFVNDRGAALAVVFFGLSTVVRGYLILKSTFLPRLLGALTVAGGLGWMLYLSPPLGDRFAPYIVGVGVLGAFVNIVWFLVFGVNEPRWKEQASAARASIWR
jgi:hypothetical protein